MDSKGRFCRRQTSALSLLAGLFVLLTVSSPFAANDASIPNLRTGYINTTHHIPLIAALDRGEEFKSSGVYLKPVLQKEKYELFADGRKLANLDIILNKSGSETATMFAMKRIDVALASITAIMTGIDRGAEVKVLCPLHVDGMSLVVPKGSLITSWDSFITRVEKAKRPIAIGYHSPTSAPKIVLESALNRAGIKVTENPNDPAANVLLVDLKSTSNFIPSLTAGQVDGVVAPAPFPEVAQLKGVGQIVTDLRDLPPKGDWHNFPCCVLAAREEMLTAHPEALRKLVELMAASTAWCNAHPAEVAAITEKWMGTPAEAVENSTIVYTVVPSKNWKQGVDTYMSILNKLTVFSGKLDGKTLEEVEKLLFAFQFIPES
ncbi:MAG: ABC transporter substrate-binding protein [Syntrophotaleaceae bacterium]